MSDGKLFPFHTGQFWTRRPQLFPFAGQVSTSSVDVADLYTIEIFTGDLRKIAAHFFFYDWWSRPGPCLYVGNQQAGPSYGKSRVNPDDSVIEGDFSQYEVTGPFSDLGNGWGRFLGSGICPP